VRLCAAAAHQHQCRTGGEQQNRTRDDRHRLEGQIEAIPNLRVRAAALIDRLLFVNPVTSVARENEIALLRSMLSQIRGFFLSALSICAAADHPDSASSHWRRRSPPTGFR